MSRVICATCPATLPTAWAMSYCLACLAEQHERASRRSPEMPPSGNCEHCGRDCFVADLKTVGNVKLCPTCTAGSLDIEGDRQRVRHAAMCADSTPPAPSRPTVYRGDVLLTLGHEIAVAGQQLRDLTAFRDRVVAAAKDPAAWMLLRQELAS